MALNLRRKIPADVPTSSMADIAFLLIIFFMLTAVYSSTRGLEFSYPKQDAVEVQPEEAIHIHIFGEGNVQVDRRPVNMEQLEGYIDSRMQQSPDKPVIIQSEMDVPYFVTIDVFDLLKKLQVRNIAIPTQAEIERWGSLWIQ
ncbi:MAG: biopolymer transporter ExbD [Acidobacteria bacterium]|nr:biopolymer transporter ExbD [Acidobacteriota bacterium]